jgi:hypothetical protein
MMSESTSDGPSDRPIFAKKFPRDAELDALVASFMAGDYAAVRKGAAKLRESVEQADVRQAAAELVSRTQTDPLIAYLFALTAALLVVLSAYWLVHDRPVPSPHPPPPVDRHVERIR